MFGVAENVVDKNLALDELGVVKEYFASRPLHLAMMATLTPECEYVFKAMIVIGQGEIFEGCDVTGMRTLVEQLVGIEEYYKEIGGIIGFQEKILEMLSENPPNENFEYCPPPMIDFREESEERAHAIDAGLEAMPQMAEIYPVGGAGERLKNKDPVTGKELPAAPFTFLGRSLLEGLLRDLKGREVLYEKKFGKKIETPVVLMTSKVKENHAVILELLEENKWFGRSPESFFCMVQPLVPTFDGKGVWQKDASGKLAMQPGGHGALWKVMQTSGAFTWLKSLGRTKAIVRQINNPLAGLDFTLLALLGVGVQKKAAFGFASCERLVGASEGVNILRIENGEGAISNIEYCDFQKFGIEDVPREAGKPYSLFPSNTNILFADLAAAEKAVQKNPYPGALLNFKGETTRLETTMQNLSDAMLERVDHLSTFLIYNHRKKTISTAKREWKPGNDVSETCMGALFDLLQNNLDLLRCCGMQVPDLTLDALLRNKPEAFFTYHPALGPLYSLIYEKIRGGKLGVGASLTLEIADVQIENLTLEGSLTVTSQDLTGKLILQNITIPKDAHIEIHLGPGETKTFSNQILT